ncbi:MAG TPA: CPBP family intramembrane glutamic endopeptidase, partial [Candidatus Obscuribacterales bacterium]
MSKVWHWLYSCPAPIRALVCLGGSVVLAAPLAVPLYRYEYAATQGKSVIWAPLCLFLAFCWLLPRWLRWVHQCRQPGLAMGLRGGNRWGRSWAAAFLIGVSGVGALYALQLLLGWGVWSPPAASTLGRSLLEGGLVGLGVGFAEELIFRGWLLFELEQDYAPPVALGLNAVIFAIAHYLRPLAVILETWPQFIGLLLLGVTLGWARRIPQAPQGRSPAPQTTLAAAAGLHGGLVFAYYQVDVNDLI